MAGNKGDYAPVPDWQILASPVTTDSELRALAKAALGGGLWGPHDLYPGVPPHIPTHGLYPLTEEVCEILADEDAAFIAAASPRRVLELLDRICEIEKGAAGRAANFGRSPTRRMRSTRPPTPSTTFVMGRGCPLRGGRPVMQARPVLRAAPARRPCRWGEIGVPSVASRLARRGSRCTCTDEHPDQMVTRPFKGMPE